MVLHSAVHLFNQEMELGLRDLADLHDLLEHYSAERDFWHDLTARARLHGLERPLYYTLRHTARLLGTRIPPDIEREAGKAAPLPPVRWLMDRLMTEAFTVPLPGRTRAARSIALWLLYLRSHWLKMPPLLLLRHLTVKALRRWRDRFGLAPSKAETQPH